MTQKIDRGELYARVWAKPMVELAKEFGVSDTGLAKLCKRYQITLPGIGYWAKLQAGKSVNKKPLKPNEQLDSEVITITPTVKDLIRYPEVQSAIDYELDPDNEIKVDLTKRLTHPIIRDLRQSLLPLTIDENINYVMRRRANNIRVTKEQQRRALIILQALIRALESRGHVVTLSKEDRLVANVFGQELNLVLNEKTEYIKVKSESAYRDEETTYKPVGKLRVEIYNGRYAEKIINERLKKPLESMLNKVLNGIYRVVDKLKHRDAYWEAWRRQQEEERQIKEARQRAAEMEAKREALVLQSMQQWQVAQKLQVFVTELERAANFHGCAADEKIIAIFAWIRRYIEARQPDNLLHSLAETFTDSSYQVLREDMYRNA